MPLPLTVPAGPGEAALALDLLVGRRILPDEELEWVKSEVPTLMAGVAALKVPLLAEVGVGANWDEAH